jgi:hypothetical protein
VFVSVHELVERLLLFFSREEIFLVVERTWREILEAGAGAVWEEEEP